MAGDAHGMPVADMRPDGRDATARIVPAYGEVPKYYEVTVTGNLTPRALAGGRSKSAEFARGM